MYYILLFFLFVIKSPAAAKMEYENELFVGMFKSIKDQHCDFKGYNLVVGAPLGKDRDILHTINVIKQILIQVLPTNSFDTNDNVYVKKAFQFSKFTGSLSENHQFMSKRKFSNNIHRRLQVDYKKSN